MKKTIFTLCLAALALSACKKADAGIPDWPWYDESDPDNWTEVTDGSFGTLPSYVKLYSADSDKIMKGTYPKVYIAVIDAAVTSFNVWGLYDPTLSGSSDALRTPTEVYNACGNPVIVLNGGFFYTDSGINYPASLAVNEGTFLSPNINYASEDWVSVYYPTRGVFVEHSGGSYEAAWTYWCDADHHYLYQSPAPNSFASAPCAQPGASYPEGSVAFEAKNAIGGGPVLIKDGKIVNTYVEELFNGETSGILVDTRHPRSAIGITADNKLVLFVCEGREVTPGIPGYTLQEVAKILLSYGCIEALNLDGGGSSCMLVNGFETVTPSDEDENGAHIERSVGSCVYIK